MVVVSTNDRGHTHYCQRLMYVGTSNLLLFGTVAMAMVVAGDTCEQNILAIPTTVNTTICRGDGSDICAPNVVCLKPFVVVYKSWSMKWIKGTETYDVVK